MNCPPRKSTLLPQRSILLHQKNIPLRQIPKHWPIPQDPPFHRRRSLPSLRLSYRCPRQQGCQPPHQRLYLPLRGYPRGNSRACLPLRRNRWGNFRSHHQEGPLPLLENHSHRRGGLLPLLENLRENSPHTRQGPNRRVNSQGHTQRGPNRRVNRCTRCPRRRITPERRVNRQCSRRSIQKGGDPASRRILRSETRRLGAQSIPHTRGRSQIGARSILHTRGGFQRSVRSILRSQGGCQRSVRSIRHTQGGFRRGIRILRSIRHAHRGWSCTRSTRRPQSFRRNQGGRGQVLLVNLWMINA